MSRTAVGLRVENYPHHMVMPVLRVSTQLALALVVSLSRRSMYETATPRSTLLDDNSEWSGNADV